MPYFVRAKSPSAGASMRNVTTANETRANEQSRRPNTRPKSGVPIIHTGEVIASTSKASGAASSSSAAAADTSGTTSKAASAARSKSAPVLKWDAQELDLALVGKACP